MSAVALLKYCESLYTDAMTGSLLFSTPTPLEYFESLVAEDASFSLTEVCVSIAQDMDPGLDVQTVLAEIDTLAERLKRRIPADAVAVQKLRWLNRYFFQDLGFAGNVNNYYSADNSYLHRVLTTRRGIPITLAVLYMELATQIGMTAHGISFPGHFLVKLSMAQGEVVIDPFTGRSLARDELDELLAPYKRDRGLQGSFDAPLGLFLQAAPPRDVVARMLRNLKEIHRTAQHLPRLLQVLHRLVILLPTAWDELRDRGLVCADLGDDQMAAADLSRYLEQAPDAHDHHAVAERLAEVVRRGSRLH